jgi:hypothetical protein
MNDLRLNPVTPASRTARRAAVTLAALLLPLTTVAAPLLRCQVAYAGTTDVIEARPVSDPYPVASVDIGGRFRFKAVMVGDAAHVEYIKLYIYLDAKRQPILVQEAKYLPPFRTTATPYLLTGEQYLYAGVAERELMYRCTLEGIAS